MAEENNTEEEEPSIEEILASIRQIISDDEEESGEDDDSDAEEHSEVVAEPDSEIDDDVAAVEKTPVAKDPVSVESASEPEVDEDDDILDLTQKVEEEAPAEEVSVEEEPDVVMEDVEPLAEPEPEIIAEDIAIEEPVMEDTGTEVIVDEMEGVVDEIAEEPVEVYAPIDQAEDDILSSSILTENAENAALDAFSTLSARSAIDNTSGVSIEDIVRDEIRPLLRVWVDENLPPMVERLLQDELEKISKRARGE